MTYRYRGGSALVTGASSGIGEAFARALARRGMALLLAARSEERLRALAGELVARHGVRVEVVPIDLAEPDAPRRLQAAADERDFEPDLLVNNAGVGALGSFVEVPLGRQLAMVHLNVEALVALCGLYLPRMVARRSGAVVNVASAAAFQPLPHFAVYAASKAFVLSFSEALWAEARRAGVRIVALCPGPVADTRFGERAGVDASFFRNVRNMPREAIVAAALRGLERNEPVVVPGVANTLTALVMNAVPRRFQLLATERLFRRYVRS
jgi:uncharacterized protein